MRRHVKRPTPRWLAIASTSALFFLAVLIVPAAAQLAASPSGLSFGSVAVGSKTTISGSFINRDTANVTINRVTVSGTTFSFGGITLPMTLAPGQSTTFKATFAPTAAGAATGGFEITSKTPMYKKHWRGTLKTYVTLSGTGTTTPSAGQLVANPTSLAFGSVPLGSSSAQNQTVTNNGGSSVSISQAAVSTAAFVVKGLNLPQTLPAGQSLTFSVIFTPQVSGSASASLTLTSDAKNTTLPIALSGSASAPGQLAVNPASLNFGNVVVGQSATQSGSISANLSSVTVTSAVPSTAEFIVSGLKLPLTLNAGQSVSYSVTFTPKATGTASATLAFSSNATTAVSAALNGAGMAPPSHSVDISWDASASSVAGYNVYRGDKAAGPFSKLNSALDLTTTFTDVTVQSGKTYYYVATAVDGGGAESGYSAPVSVSIPTP